MPDYSNIPDSEINRLCAERCGWTRSFGTDAATSSYVHPKARTPDGDLKTEFPNYCRDRNALVELWRFLDEHDHIWDTYMHAVVDDLGLRPFDRAKRWITATPRQHAEAFLKATEGQG